MWPSSAPGVVIYLCGHQEHGMLDECGLATLGLTSQGDSLCMVELIES